jgi:hypothetical protein
MRIVFVQYEYVRMVNECRGKGDEHFFPPGQITERPFEKRGDAQCLCTCPDFPINRIAGK